MPPYLFEHKAEVASGQAGSAPGLLDCSRRLEISLNTVPVYVRTLVLRFERSGRRPQVVAAHSPGTLHHLYAVSGKLRCGPVTDPVELAAGDFVRFPGDVAHLYACSSERAVAHMVTRVPQMRQFGPAAPGSGARSGSGDLIAVDRGHPGGFGDGEHEFTGGQVDLDRLAQSGGCGGTKRVRVVGGQGEYHAPALRVGSQQRRDQGGERGGQLRACGRRTQFDVVRAYRVGSRERTGQAPGKPDPGRWVTRPGHLERQRHAVGRRSGDPPRWCRLGHRDRRRRPHGRSNARTARLSSFPEALRGNASTNWTRRGSL